MSIKTSVSIAVTSLVLAFVSVAHAQVPIAYSATALHALPGQAETSGTVIKSGENMRLEFISQGKSIIQILRPEIGAMYILDPAAHTFMEVLGPAVPATTTQGYTNPCPGQLESQTCQRVGNDNVSGIAVERWLLSTNAQTKPISMLWDPTRRRALRQDFPDGGAMIMSFNSMRDLNGRNTEYWTIAMISAGQPSANGDWWFDPQLRVVVRETLPNGETRRLENITVGPVDPAAFQVPQGWQKLELPRAQP